MKVLCKIFCAILIGLLLTLGSAFSSAELAFADEIVDFAISYPNRSSTPSDLRGSTHEMVFNGDTLWITGQNYDQLVAIKPDGTMSFYPMPQNSGPHGIAFDQAGQLWVTLEFAGEIIRLDPRHPYYNSATKYDVQLECTTCTQEIDTHPHGLAIGSDGQTVWYTGKATGTIGRITPDGTIETFPISTVNNPRATVGSVPIYIHADAEGNMWFTELVGNAIGRITSYGTVEEFKIPTLNSRPIAIVPGPDGNMWFTEEAGNNVGRIKRNCKTNCITEFPVPKLQNNVLLAALAFDTDHNLWVQQYVDANHPSPPGNDHLIKIDKQILTTNSSDISNIPIDFYNVPTSGTVMHRIILGSDGNFWFTELKTDKVGKVNLSFLRDS
jgi:virginiamycin B lyase